MVVVGVVGGNKVVGKAVEAIKVTKVVVVCISVKAKVYGLEAVSAVSNVFKVSEV